MSIWGVSGERKSALLVGWGHELVSEKNFVSCLGAWHLFTVQKCRDVRWGTLPGLLEKNKTTRWWFESNECYYYWPGAIDDHSMRLTPRFEQHLMVAIHTVAEYDKITAQLVRSRLLKVEERMNIRTPDSAESDAVSLRTWPHHIRSRSISASTYCKNLGHFDP